MTLEQRVQKTLKLYDSKQGQRIWAMNKYVHELDDKKNWCGIIQKATGLLKYEEIEAVRVEAEKRIAERGKTE